MCFEIQYQQGGWGHRKCFRETMDVEVSTIKTIMLTWWDSWWDNFDVILDTFGVFSQMKQIHYKSSYSSLFEYRWGPLGKWHWLSPFWRTPPDCPHHTPLGLRTSHSMNNETVKLSPEKERNSGRVTCGVSGRAGTLFSASDIFTPNLCLPFLVAKNKTKSFKR